MGMEHGFDPILEIDAQEAPPEGCLVPSTQSCGAAGLCFDFMSGLE